MYRTKLSLNQKGIIIMSQSSLSTKPGYVIETAKLFDNQSLCCEFACWILNCLRNLQRIKLHLHFRLCAVNFQLIEIRFPWNLQNYRHENALVLPVNCKLRCSFWRFWRFCFVHMRWLCVSKTLVKRASRVYYETGFCLTLNNMLSIIW